MSIAVSFLKRLPFVAANPKLWATILSALATVLALLPGLHSVSDLLNAIGGNLGATVAAVATTAAAAVATHEVAHPLTRAIGIDPTSAAPSASSAPPPSPSSPLQGK